MKRIMSAIKNVQVDYIEILLENLQGNIKTIISGNSVHMMESNMEKR